MDSIGIINNICIEVGTFWIIFHNYCLHLPLGINLQLILLQFLFCHAQRYASNQYPHNTTNQKFPLISLLRLLKGGWFVEIFHWELIVFFLHITKKGHQSSMKWWNTFSYLFWRRIIAHKYLICVSLLINIIYL